MSFMRINGWVVPVLDGSPSVSPEIIGHKGRAFDGTMLSDERAIKRVWRGSSNQLNELAAKALECILQGKGFCWPYDTDLYSHKGFGPLSSPTPVTTIRNNTAADGDPVLDENGIDEAKFGGALYVHETRSNILTADQRDCENAPTGFESVNGATLSADTSNYWEQTKSLKTVTDLVGSDQEGFRTAAIDPGAGSAGKTYYATVYLKGNSGGEVLEVDVEDTTNTAWGPTTTVTLTDANKWYRVKAYITIGGSDCRAMKIRVLEQAPDSGYTYFADGLQIEEGGYPTSWFDGSRGGGTIEFDSSVFASFCHDMTVSAWVKGWTANPSAQIEFFQADDDSENNVFSLYRASSSNNLVFFTEPASGTGGDSLTYATSPWDDDWHMVTAVLRRNAESGENIKSLYFDGSLVGSSNPAVNTLPACTDFTRLTMGKGRGAGSQWQGAIDDLQMLPFAASADLVTAWYNMAKAMPNFPNFYVDGDIMPDNELEVLARGVVEGSKFVVAKTGGVARNNNRLVSMKIEES